MCHQDRMYLQEIISIDVDGKVEILWRKLSLD